MIHELVRVYVINTFWSIFKIVSSLLSRFHVLHSSCTGLDAAPLTPSCDNQEKGLESGGFCEAISFASEVPGFLWQVSNLYH